MCRLHICRFLRCQMCYFGAWRNNYKNTEENKSSPARLTRINIQTAKCASYEEIRLKN